MTLVPAYGRDYKSKAAVEADLRAGKDFVIADMFNPDDGRYVNLEQLPKGKRVNIRYKQLRNVAVIVV